MKKNGFLLIIGLTSLSLSTVNFAHTLTPKKHLDQISVREPLAPATIQTEPAGTESLSGTFALTSNYIFRGISQTSNLPAVQGGFNYKIMDSGLYLGAWGSNVKFSDLRDATATLELDATLGYTCQFSENGTWDIKLQRYSYPKTIASYNEVVTSLNYQFITAQLGYSPNVFNTHNTGIYYNLGATFGIPARYIANTDNVSLTASVGHYNLPKRAALVSYNDYLLQLSKTYKNYVMALQYTDTGRSADAPALRGRKIVGSVTVNF